MNREEQIEVKVIEKFGSWENLAVAFEAQSPVAACALVNRRRFKVSGPVWEQTYTGICQYDQDDGCLRVRGSIVGLKNFLMDKGFALTEVLDCHKELRRRRLVSVRPCGCYSNEPSG